MTTVSFVMHNGPGTPCPHGGCKYTLREQGPWQNVKDELGL
jgi:hypothetical protein